MADQASGTSSLLRVTGVVVGQDAAARWVDILVTLSFHETSSSIAYDASGISADITFGPGSLWSGTFTFDWRPGGLQSVTIVSGTYRVYYDAWGASDGNPPAGFRVIGSIGATGTSGAGGPTTVTEYLSLPTLKVVPGTPSSCAAVRNSDSQVTVSWAQSSASNGQPTTNTIRRKINGGAWADVVAISPATSAAIAAAANQKLVYGVKASNSAGDSGWSADSTPVYTTPASPSGVTATKVGSDIVVAWTPNVAFSEHTHVVERSFSTDGGATWSAWSTLTSSVASGTSTYTHVAPNNAQVHRYRVSAKNTDVGALTSSTVVSNSVQLLVAPNKPTIPALAPFQDKAATFRFPWVHNPVDTTSQTKRQVRYSIDGGTTWTTGSKTSSSALYLDFAGSTWAANVAVTFQVRTKGDYDSGADGDASYSPWSDSVTVTFKTKPVATITTPANSSTYVQAALTAALGFSQAESATFVSATIGLYASGGVTLLEEIVSTTLAGTLFTTRLADSTSYVLKATVTDSNGITSAQVTSSFSVDYTEPVAAVVVLTYLPDSGIAQIDLTIPGAGGGLAAAVSVTIDRSIDGVSESVVAAYPSASTLTILDLTPTIHGDNVYRVTTKSVDGATTVVTDTLTTAEDRWAFMSKGAGYEQIVRFTGALKPQASPTVDSALVKAAGRSRPIGLYATTGGLVVSGRGDLVTGLGSSAEEIESFLLVAGKACYRDPSGRRVFGMVSGKVAREHSGLGSFDYSVTETS